MVWSLTCCYNSCKCKLHVESFLSPDAMLILSFWSALRIVTSGKTWFSEHGRSNCLLFLANQICQIWWEVCESESSSVFAHAQKTGMARDPNSWCWPRGQQPLGMRMHDECSWKNEGVCNASGINLWGQLLSWRK